MVVCDRCESAGSRAGRIWPAFCTFSVDANQPAVSNTEAYLETLPAVPTRRLPCLTFLPHRSAKGQAMLTLCDGKHAINRRGFLTIGSLGCLSLPSLFAA